MWSCAMDYFIGLDTKILLFDALITVFCFAA
jgi:hypothetical protein